MTTDAPQPTSPIPDHIHCPKCAYDLTASTSPKCSECGYDLAGFRQTESAIPWTHRKTQGYLRTYIKTVWLVIFKHKKFCEEIVRPVNYGDARKFQLVTVILAFLPTLATMIGAYWDFPNKTYLLRHGRYASFWASPIYLINLKTAYIQVWPIVLAMLSYLVSIYAITGLPSYFFHPPQLPIRRQNRATALSYYTAAPLALFSIAYVVEIVVIGYYWWNRWGFITYVKLPKFIAVNSHIVFQITVEVTITCICWLIYYCLLIKLHKQVMPLALKKRATLYVSLPLAWAITLLVFLVGLPFAVFYMMVIVNSLM